MAATVKLTRQEAIDLVAVLEDRIGAEKLVPAIYAAITADKATALTVNREAVKLTRTEKIALIKAIVPLIPGETAQAKILWCIKAARLAFATEARFREVMQYVVERIKRHKAEQAAGPVAAPGKVPAWDKATRASCWNGSNANQRMMNILSPKFSDAKYKQYRDWMLSIGCNAAHVFLSNKGDGEGAGYCVYGAGWTWKIDTSYCKTFRERIADLRAHGFAVAPWLFADDSSAWNKEAKKNFPKYLADLKAQGLLDQASIVVAGLEMDEYYGSSDVAALVNAIRKVWAGKVGTHQTSGRFEFSALADIVFYQVKPGKTAAQIKSEAQKVVKATRKPLCFFELDRQPNRALCDAAMSGGAFAVGNWKGDAASIPQQPAGDDVDLSTAKWIGPDGSKAKVTETLSSLTFDGKQFKYKQSAGTAKWTPRTGAKTVNQYACFFVRRDGRWAGGKFDWSSETRSSRSRTNIDAGYTGGIVPKAGEEVRFCLMDLNGKNRTNAPGVKWK